MAATGDSMAAMRSLGPVSQRLLRQVGITSAAQLAAADPFLLYAALKARDARVSLNLLYALIGAIEDRDWREVARSDRTRILMRLDELGLAPK